jgi:hypothetical protein
MRLVFAIQLYFYFVWSLGSENITEWFLYAFLMWIAAYYLHQYNWEKRKSYRMAIALYSMIIYSFIFCCRLISLVGNDITL